MKPALDTTTDPATTRRHGPRPGSTIAWNAAPAPWTAASLLGSAWARAAGMLPAPLRLAGERVLAIRRPNTPLYVSRFTTILESQRGSTLLFHGVHGALDELTDDDARVLRRAHSGPAPLRPDELPARQAVALLRRGHLTTLDPAAEQRKYQRYVSKVHALQEAARPVGLFVVPSYRCNLSCTYCYQATAGDRAAHLHSPVMSEATLGDLLEHALPEAFGTLDEMCIELHGGEPFLPVHEGVIRRLLELARRRGQGVSATTNGTEIHRFPDLFGPGPGQVDQVLLTLDGPAGVHDRLRIRRGGGGTFQRIIDNARLLLDRGTRVGFRIHLSHENAGHLRELADVLTAARLLEGQTSVLCACVEKVRRASGGAGFPRLLDTAALQELLERDGLEQVLGSPLELACRDVEAALFGEDRLRLDRTAACMYAMPRSLVVDGHGDVYGCVSETGDPARRVGRLLGARLIFNARRDTCLRRTVQHLEPCRSCPIGLLCGGGCPLSAEREKGSIFAGCCDHRRELVERAVVRVHQRACEELR